MLSIKRSNLGLFWKMKNQQSIQPKPKRILVIAMRFLGDVLLTTPLLHSLRVAYPDAQLDVLVYGNTASMLEGNPDLSHVITTPNRPKFSEYWQLIRKLFRRYDLAVVTQTGDRPFLYGLLAAPLRVAVVPKKKTTGWRKRYFVKHWTEFDDNTHTVLQHLKLLQLINVPQYCSLVPPQINSSHLQKQYSFLADNTDFVVLHPHPQWAYKQWTLEGWIEVGQYLKSLGLTIVLSCGPAQQEKDYVRKIKGQLPADTVNLEGKVSLAQLAYIIAQAKLYIGPDTGITHLAAATGVPVIALYGPTNPVKWAPFPFGYLGTENPFDQKGDQQVNNVYLLQGAGDCVPCDLEGCDSHRQSHSLCLDGLSADAIKRLVRTVLNK